MNISAFESNAFAGYQHLTMILNKHKTYSTMSSVIYMGTDSYTAFCKWPETAHLQILEIADPEDTVVAMLDRIPVVVEGNGGMQVVLMPTASEEYQIISTQLPDEEPEVEPEIIQPENVTDEDADNASAYIDETLKEQFAKVEADLEGDVDDGAVGELATQDETVSEDDEQQQ